MWLEQLHISRHAVHLVQRLAIAQQTHLHRVHTLVQMASVMHCLVARLVHVCDVTHSDV